MAKKRKKKAIKRKVQTRKSSAKSSTKKSGMTLAIIGLLLNILILPGLGSLIGGRTKTGIWQLILSVIGIVLSFVIIGIPILIASWIWALVTGIQMIQEA
jgi:TM2 domain-containing membrane protein YozV